MDSWPENIGLTRRDGCGDFAEGRSPELGLSGSHGFVEFYIYVIELVDGGDTHYYIGETKNIEKRIGQHKREGGDFSASDGMKFGGVVEVEAHVMKEPGTKEFKAKSKRKEIDKFIEYVENNPEQRVHGAGVMYF